MKRSAKSHQSARSKSVVWLTPEPIIDALGGPMSFDLDPCSLLPRPHRTAKAHYYPPIDGLRAPWQGRIWLNPPYSTQALRAWLKRMAAHAHGVALIPAATDTEAFHEHVFGAAHALMFLGPTRLHFNRPDGVQAANNSGAPSVLCAYGAEDAETLSACGLGGEFVVLRLPRLFVFGLAATAVDTESWVEAVMAWMRMTSGPVPLKDIYRAFAHHPKAAGRDHYRAKLRQTLQRGPFRRVRRGAWELAA